MPQVPYSKQFLGETFIRSVVDMKDEPLGWAVCVLVRQEKQPDEMLVLRHCAYKDEAQCIEQGISDYVRRNLGRLTELASPREFWEWNTSMLKPSGEGCWTVLEGDTFKSFCDEQHPIRVPRCEWYPDGLDSLAHWSTQYGTPNDEWRMLLTKLLNDQIEGTQL